MKHTLLILLENEPGALSRVVGLFSQRGYNIESITVSPTEDNSISIVTIQTSNDKKTIEQIIKHLKKLINVLKVTKINQKNYIEREILLIKLKILGYSIERFKLIIKIFNLKIIDNKKNTYIIQIYGSNKKINSFLNRIKEVSKIIEISRSGIIGINKISI